MTRWLDEIGPGWRPIVAWAINEIEGLGGTITQVKEKFGGLRIYYFSESNSDQIDKIVRKAEGICSICCEECGRPGKLISDGGCMKTVCEECK